MAFVGGQVVFVRHETYPLWPALIQNQLPGDEVFHVKLLGVDLE
jgi:hypothetical protein